MDSNHELDRFFKHRNLLILQSRRSRQKPQKQACGTKSVQNSPTLQLKFTKTTTSERGLLGTDVHFARQASPQLLT